MNSQLLTICVVFLTNCWPWVISFVEQFILWQERNIKLDGRLGLIWYDSLLSFEHSFHREYFIQPVIPSCQPWGRRGADCIIKPNRRRNDLWIVPWGNLCFTHWNFKKHNNATQENIWLYLMCVSLSVLSLRPQFIRLTLFPQWKRSCLNRCLRHFQLIPQWIKIEA